MGLTSLFRELRQRRVVRALLAYGAGTAAVLQGTDMVFTALALPDLAYRIIVIASIAGFPLVVVLAWVYDLTADGLRRTPPAPVAAAREPATVARYLQLVGAFTVAALVVVATAGAVSTLRYPSSDDGRVGLAVFPLRAQGSAGAEWSEGAADLLATVLEGTPDLRIVDPWSLWSPLRPEAGAPARAPDAEQASTLARSAGAHRYVLGSVVPAGDRLEITMRLYRLGRAEPMDVFTLSSTPDGMPEAVRTAAVRVIARVQGATRPADVPSELDFDATQSPDALKAYLAAKEAMRRGMIDSANAAIDRAVDLDSTFVLAVIEAVYIKSWALSLRGRAFTGFFQLLAEVEPFEADLVERSRLRLEAVRASIRTDGPRAIEALRRLLEIDPMDYGANALLEYCLRMYGWQLTPPESGSRELAERVVQLDSTQLPALAIREWWAVAMGDTQDGHVQLGRLLRGDTSALLARSKIRGLRALLADAEDFERLLPGLVELPGEDFAQVVAHLRAGNPARYGRLLDATGAVPGSRNHTAALAEGIRFDLARGWAGRVDSTLAAGGYPGMPHETVAMLVLAADLADMGEPGVGERIVAWLGRYVPADSAAALFQDRQVWQAGWLIGAWHAELGDSMVARRWIRALGTLPPGGTSDDYRGALQADIEARLAARRGDRDGALAQQRSAMKLWTIHTDNALEISPSPLMRLHLALLLRESGQRNEAEALFSSLVPPTTWMGFVTARAELELGELAGERGDTIGAALHFGRVLATWDHGGPGVAAYAQRARAGLPGAT